MTGGDGGGDDGGGGGGVVVVVVVLWWKGTVLNMSIRIYEYRESKMADYARSDKPSEE